MCSVATTLVVGLQFLRLTQETTFRENEIRRLSPSGRADCPLNSDLSHKVTWICMDSNTL
jgi:hypothetical protein